VPRSKFINQGLEGIEKATQKDIGERKSSNYVERKR